MGTRPSPLARTTDWSIYRATATYKWERIFANSTAPAAAIDRVVHHSVILEFDIPSYRTGAAQLRSAAKEVDRQNLLTPNRQECLTRDIGPPGPVAPADAIADGYIMDDSVTDFVPRPWRVPWVSWWTIYLRPALR